MKPVSGDEIASEQDKVRKSLHELQPSAIDKETLVGADRMIKSTQQVKEVKSKKNVPVKMKKDVPKKQKKVTTNDKAIQTITVPEKVDIEAEDLICTDLAGPSENYWQVVAEKRRVALKNALEENKELIKRIEKLEEKIRIYKEMLDETKSLVEVLQDMIEDDRNDMIEDDRNDINNSLEDSVL